MISESYAQRIKDYIKDVIKNNDVMNSQKTLPADFVAMSAAAKLFTKSALMGMDGSVRHYEFEEIPDIEDIENLPFTEAVEYLKKRSVLSKVDYEKLSDKLRFRAFTASRIADGDLLKRINAELIENVDSGDGLKSFLNLTKDELLDKVGMGANQGWYWETVYRTNVQTAYNVGRAMAFEQDKPLAYELIAIDDNRTTDICRPYATKRVVLASDDPFWKTHWPPFHFNCRTTVRAIYDESELPEHFESVQDVPSAKGFGEYPLNTDSWWQELESQSARAKDYGIQEEIEEARKILIESNWKTGRSVGAMARRFYVDVSTEVKMPNGIPAWYIKEGSEVSGIKVIAQGENGGKESKRKIDDIKRLIKQYPKRNGKLTSPKDWYKVRGTAILYNGETKEEMKAEIHYYYGKDVGKVEFKYKRQIK